MARWATLINAKRAENPVLLLDVGGFCRYRNTSHKELKDRFFFEGVEMLGYDAMGIGESEIRFGRTRLEKAKKAYSLPLLSANILDKKSGKPIAAPYTIKHVGGRRTLFGQRGGIRIGIFSVVLPGYIYSIDREAQRFYEVKNPGMTALETASRLKSMGCDLVIALSYQGWTKSAELAEAAAGIDIVLNGRKSHHSTYSERFGNTIAVDIGNKRTSLTEIDITFENGKPLITARDVGKEVLESEADPDLAALEKRFEKEKTQIETGGGSR
jgi:2',3'-cyclic-nucleotide 2'-phosphodiesterase (5'-nucleotidase family)